VLKLLLHASSKDLTQWAADRFLLSFLRYSETSLPLEISLCFRGYQGTIDDLRSSLASTLFYGERISQNTQQLQDMLRKKYESLFFASFFFFARSCSLFRGVTFSESENESAGVLNKLLQHASGNDLNLEEYAVWEKENKEQQAELRAKFNIL